MKTRIISLGEIVTVNISKAIGAYIGMIASKNLSVSADIIGKQVGGVLQSKMDFLNQFKLGKVTENQFDQEMIGALAEATGVTLTVEEFNQCWNAMNPAYAQFADLLNEADAFNKQSGQKIIFISFTNPKDMRHLEAQLQKNNVLFKTENGELSEICGMKLLSSYSLQQAKNDLIVTAYYELQPAGKPGALFSNNTPADIKYIRGVNNINDKVLSADWDKITQSVEAQANELRIPSVIWKKHEKQTLNEVLNASQPAANLPAMML
ncbi:MAG TPA: hypothetical protein VL360_02950 [Gammaproteobacteria bacterium]|jgi:hypothetical protein|nr:hypothetical protein [Gammaproteobacteria bacterium]